MQHPLRLLITGCIALVFASFIHAQNQPAYQVHTSDVVHFWQAFDSVQTTNDPARQIALIQKTYVDQGTQGLKEFMELRGGNAEKWQKMMVEGKDRMLKIRPYTLSLVQQQPVIEQKLAILKSIYPDFKPGDIFFTIGVGNSGGTVEGLHVLIGAEVTASEKPNWAVPIVLHEFIHTQQQSPCNADLLSACILEGMAEFVSELTLDQPLATIYPSSHIAFGLQHEKEVWDRFKMQMHSIDHLGWLYGGSGQTFAGTKMNDMGYFMGYVICKSYYKHAKDKKAAIKYMLETNFCKNETARKFLLASGYVPQEDVAFVKKMKFAGDVKKTIVGYRKTRKNIVFQVDVPQQADLSTIKSISIAGSFNNWNPTDPAYLMTFVKDRHYELAIPKTQFKKGETHTFKFVVNGDNWISAPENAKNVDEGGYRNLVVRR